MRIQELAEELQPILEEGILNLIVYQEGRQWKYTIYDTSNDKAKEESQKKYLTLKLSVDDKATIVNGKKDFTDYDLKSIQNQIKDLRG